MLVERSIDNFKKVQWLDKYLSYHNGFIAGGCFKNILNNEKVKDIDMFFENEVEFNNAVNYFEKDIDYLGELSYSRFYENNKVIAFKDNSNGLVIELIRHEFGIPEEILNSFDFTIVKFAYYKKKVPLGDNELFDDYDIVDTILIDDMFFEHLFEKRLVIDNNILFPLSTFERVLKYARYGYFPCLETKTKLIKAIKEDTKDIASNLTASLYNGID